MFLIFEIKGAEKKNEEGAVETKVDTVDYSWPAGHSKEEEPNKEKVEVVHLSQPKDDSSGGAAGLVTDAAAAVASKVQSAKDAISGGGNTSK